ncbi:MAG: LPXTG cell wall anchor domain-containing protein [Desulfobacterales bacterium]
MKKLLLPLVFAALGLLDFLYGLYRGDRVSILVGLVMVGIAVYIIRKKRS